MIKNILFIIAFMFFTSMNVNASKAGGRPMPVKQPDGTTLMVRLLGDEHMSWYQTMDGVLLVPRDNAYYVAEVLADGTLACTDMLAHNADTRSDAEAMFVKKQNKTAFFVQETSKAKSGMQKASGYPTTARCPHSGKVKIPVVLMEYPDRKFSLQGEELRDTFNHYFNRETRLSASLASQFIGHSSVRTYFLDASHGKLDLEFEIYGPYTSNYNHTKYGHNNKNGNSASVPLKQEAIEKANDDIDFTEYDSDGDGNVDMLYIVYAGLGANFGEDDTAIWPHCANNYSFFADDMRINVIGVSNEVINVPVSETKTEQRLVGIGVLCHEFSHGMGLPDLYWTTSDVPTDERGLPDYNNCGPEFWDLMDGGENIHWSFWPVQYAAWEKEAMGWIEFEELKEPQRVTIYPFDSFDKEGNCLGKACVVKNPENEDEYYVIENFMCSRNHWNYTMWSNYASLSYKTPGLMITHVNGYKGIAPTMTPNNTYGKPNITLLPADGFIMAELSIGKECWYDGKAQEITNIMYSAELAGDPYPGTDNVTEITSYKNYTGEDMGTLYPISDITVNADRSISFYFRKAEYIATSISNMSETNNAERKKIYSVDGRYMGCDANVLPNGVYIKNGKKFIVR